MFIQYANFIKSAPHVNLCPPDDKAEYAFIGRSNVGKSSLINYLTNKKDLAKVSSTPGKTQLINHYEINNDWYIVDLPGYGYAKVSKTKRKEWEKFIRNYLLLRKNLQCVFLLIDSRIPPQKIDIEFINWLGEMQIAFVLVYTKHDKRNNKKCKENVIAFQKKMLETWAEMPKSFVSSTKDKKGANEILTFIASVNKEFERV